MKAEYSTVFVRVVEFCYLEWLSFTSSPLFVDRSNTSFSFPDQKVEWDLTFDLEGNAFTSCSRLGHGNQRSITRTCTLTWEIGMEKSNQNATSPWLETTGMPGICFGPGGWDGLAIASEGGEVQIQIIAVLCYWIAGNRTLSSKFDQFHWNEAFSCSVLWAWDQRHYITKTLNSF